MSGGFYRAGLSTSQTAWIGAFRGDQRAYLPDTADASATGSPAAEWAYADFGDTLELTDRSAGAAATRSAFVLAVLGSGLSEDAFDGARWFALGSDAARSAEVSVVIPEPGMLVALAGSLLVIVGRRRQRI